MGSRFATSIPMSMGVRRSARHTKTAAAAVVTDDQAGAVPAPDAAPPLAKTKTKKQTTTLANDDRADAKENALTTRQTRAKKGDGPTAGRSQQVKAAPGKSTARKRGKKATPADSEQEVADGPHYDFGDLGAFATSLTVSPLRGQGQREHTDDHILALPNALVETIEGLNVEMTNAHLENLLDFENELKAPVPASLLEPPSSPLTILDDDKDEEPAEPQDAKPPSLDARSVSPLHANDDSNPRSPPPMLPATSRTPPSHTPPPHTPPLHTPPRKVSHRQVHFAATPSPRVARMHIQSPDHDHHDDAPVGPVAELRQFLLAKPAAYISDSDSDNEDVGGNHRSASTSGPRTLDNQQDAFLFARKAHFPFDSRPQFPKRDLAAMLRPKPRPAHHGTPAPAFVVPQKPGKEKQRPPTATSNSPRDDSDVEHRPSSPGQPPHAGNDSSDEMMLDDERTRTLNPPRSNDGSPFEDRARRTKRARAQYHGMDGRELDSDERDPEWSEVDKAQQKRERDHNSSYAASRQGKYVPVEKEDKQLYREYERDTRISPDRVPKPKGLPDRDETEDADHYDHDESDSHNQEYSYDEQESDNPQQLKQKSRSKKRKGKRGADPGSVRSKPVHDDSDLDSEAANTPWPVKPGPMSKEAEAEVDAALANFKTLVSDIGRKHAVSKRVVWERVGVFRPLIRNTNPWVAFEFVYRKRNGDKPKHITSAEYLQQIQAEYHDLTKHLDPKDEVAKREIHQPYIDEYEEANSLACKEVKKKGPASVKSVLKRAVVPFTSQSQALNLNTDIHVMGFAMELAADTGITFGGSDVFLEMLQRFPDQVQAVLAEVKSMMQLTNRQMRTEAATGEPSQRTPRLVAIRTHKPGQKIRDYYRGVFTDALLNDTLVAMTVDLGFTQERAMQIFKTMHWSKWNESAVTYHLRLVHWPVGMKSIPPGPGWQFTKVSKKSSGNKLSNKKKQITNDSDDASESDTDALHDAADHDANDSTSDVGGGKNKKPSRQKTVVGSGSDDEDQDNHAPGSFMEMCARLVHVHKEGEEDETVTRVEAWTQEEIDMEDPSNVPIVICADGTVLRRASDSRELLKQLQKKADAAVKAAEKAKKKQTKNAARPPKAGSSVGQKRHTPDSPVVVPPPKRQHREESPELPRAKTTGVLCKYIDENGNESGTFTALRVERRNGEETQELTPADKNTWVEKQGRWGQLPSGLRLVLTDEEMWMADDLQRDMGFIE